MVVFPDLETFSFAEIPAVGKWDIDIENTTVDTTGDTLTAKAVCPGETVITLGTCAGAGIGVALQINVTAAINATVLEGIVYELNVAGAEHTLIPNDTDGRYLLRKRDDGI